MRAVSVAMAEVARGVRATLQHTVRVTRALFLRMAVTLAIMAIGHFRQVETNHASTVFVSCARLVGRVHRGH